MRPYEAKQTWIKGKPAFYVRETEISRMVRVSLEKGRELFEAGVFGKALHLKEFFEIWNLSGKKKISG